MPKNTFPAIAIAVLMVVAATSGGQVAPAAGLPQFAREKSAIDGAFPAFGPSTGFEQARRSPRPHLSLEGISDTVYARRASDGLGLKIDICIAGSADIATKWFHARKKVYQAAPTTGTFSGDRLGEQAFQSPHTGLPMGNWDVAVRDGRAFVCLALDLPISHDRGKVVFRAFTRDQLLYAERMVRDILARLASGGYTSVTSTPATKRK